MSEKNIQNASEAERENLSSTIQELLQAISLKTLAALAVNDDTTELALTYLAFMEVFQAAVVVPMLSSEHLSAYLQDKPFERHREYLSHATALQKLAYFQRDLAPDEQMTTWEMKTKPELVELIAAFKQEPSEEKYQEIQSKSPLIFSGTKITIQQQQLNISALKKICSLFGHETKLAEVAPAYIEAKARKLAVMERDLHQLGLEVAALAQLVPGHEEIPDELVDPITGEMMTNPMKDRHGNILDETTWQNSGSNPYTRESLESSQIVVDEQLKARIEAYNHRQ